LAITNNGACPALAFERTNNIDVDAQLTERVRDISSIGSAHKTDEHDIAAQLSEDPRNIASFAARLNDHSLGTLNTSGLEMIDFENAVYCEIRANHQEHATRQEHKKRDLDKIQFRRRSLSKFEPGLERHDRISRRP
jgi:hypothetical protein